MKYIYVRLFIIASIKIRLETTFSFGDWLNKFYKNHVMKFYAALRNEEMSDISILASYQLRPTFCRGLIYKKKKTKKLPTKRNLK
jgi:hypothetical protein